MGPISARSPGRLLQDEVLVMADKLNKCGSAYIGVFVVGVIFWGVKKLKAGH